MTNAAQTPAPKADQANTVPVLELLCLLASLGFMIWGATIASAGDTPRIQVALALAFWLLGYGLCLLRVARTRGPEFAKRSALIAAVSVLGIGLLGWLISAF